MKSLSISLLLLAFVVVFPSSCTYTAGRYHDGQEFKKALELQRQGLLWEALAIYNSISPHERRYVGALNNMAVIYAVEGDLENAEDLLVLATNMEPDLVTMWANLGVVRYMSGHQETAVKALKEVQPARRRMLERVISNGRTPWAYYDLEAKTRRSMQVAEKYLNQLAAEGYAMPEKPQALPRSILAYSVPQDLVVL